MKRYYNETTQEWYTEGYTITKQLDNGQLFVGIPTEQQLYSWGFAVYEEPEPTIEERLEQAKAEKIATIEEYDKSTAVNGFEVTINGLTFTHWIDPATRADYKDSIDAAELLNMTEVHPVFNGIPITLSVQMAKMALAQIQIYANQCFNVTEQHKKAVSELTTFKEVKQYDYTSGYPTRLTFNID